MKVRRSQWCKCQLYFINLFLKKLFFDILESSIWDPFNAYFVFLAALWLLEQLGVAPLLLCPLGLLWLCDTISFLVMIFYGLRLCDCDLAILFRFPCYVRGWLCDVLIFLDFPLVGAIVILKYYVFGSPVRGDLVSCAWCARIMNL